MVLVTLPESERLDESGGNRDEDHRRDNVRQHGTHERGTQSKHHQDTPGISSNQPQGRHAIRDPAREAVDPHRVTDDAGAEQKYADPVRPRTESCVHREDSAQNQHGEGGKRRRRNRYRLRNPPRHGPQENSQGAHSDRRHVLQGRKPYRQQKEERTEPEAGESLALLEPDFHVRQSWSDFGQALPTHLLTRGGLGAP